MERRAISHARGNGDDRAVRHAADDACERTFHARDGDDDRRSHDVVQMGQKPVEASDTDIVKPCHAVA